MCDYDPFPSFSNFSWTVVWPRRAAEYSRKSDNGAADVDALTSSMEKLSLRPASDMRPGQITGSKSVFTDGRRMRDQWSPCCPTLITLPSAPLPALIRTTVTVRSKSTTLVTTSLSQHTVSQSTLQRQPFCPRQPMPCISAHRVPKSSPMLLRQVAHPYLTRPRSITRTRRLSSASSCSSISSESSTTSSLSSVDSPLNTPLYVTANLPDPAKLCTSKFLLSPVPYLDPLFGPVS